MFGHELSLASDRKGKITPVTTTRLNFGGNFFPQTHFLALACPKKFPSRYKPQAFKKNFSRFLAFPHNSVGLV
jgi:hypothetical protein